MSYLFRKFTLLRPNNLRVFNKIKDLVKHGFTPDPKEILRGEKLSEVNQFQYPTEIREAVDRDPQTIQEEQEVLEETEKIVSDLERARMQELDKIYGTSTHFHPINEVFEERLDSEHVMERRRAKRKHMDQIYQPARFFERDPQTKFEAPKIRNKQDFYKNLKKIMHVPEHPRMGSTVTNKFETYTDYFAYLEDKSLIDPTQKMQQGSPEYMKILEFISKENLLSEMSFFHNAHIEDKIIKDFNECQGSDNKFPLFYDNTLYYQKEGTNEGLNLYRVRIDNNASNNLISKLLVESSALEQNIINQQELLDFITQYAEGENNELGRIPHDLLVSIKYNENRFELYDITFSNNQQNVALTFEMNVLPDDVFNTHLTIIKNVETGKYQDIMINHAKGSPVFDDIGGLYYIKKNETNRAGFLYRYDFNVTEKSKAEKVIIEEGDPLFELESTGGLRVTKTLSNEYLLLNSVSVSGDPTNEMYIRPLNDPYQEFHLLLPREKGLEYNVKHSKDYLILLMTDHIEGTQTTKRIRIIQEKSSKNLLEAGEKLGEQMQLLASSALVFKTSQDKSELVSKSTNEKTPIQSKALVVARLHAIEKQEIKNVYGLLEEFPIAEDGEKILYYAGFEGYIIFHVRNEDKEYIKVYNHRSEKTHTLKFNEEAQLGIENNYRYNNQYYHFVLNTPQVPARVLSYNLGLRDLQVIHTEHIVGLKPEDFTLEKINITARDGTEIPVTFVYNNKRMDSDSPVVLHAEFDLESRAYMNFKPELLGLLNRGFIVAYPHIRGCKDLNETWFEKGSGIQRLTSVTDLLDTANYLLMNEVTPNVCLYGKGRLGGTLSAIAALKEPDLFTATVLEDPVIDLTSYLFDHEDRLTKNIFGDINDQDIYEHTKQYSPYLSKVPKELVNMLVIANANSEQAAHGRKLIAKIRDTMKDKRNLNKIYFREIAPNSPEIFTTALWQGFVINSVFKQDKIF